MTWVQRARREGFAVVAVLVVLACGGDDGPSANAGSIQVAVDPGALSVQQGGTGSVTVALTRGGGFAGPVNLAIAGLPAGVTTAITPAQLSGAAATATIDVTVGAAVALGVYTATITATAQGVSSASSTYELTVTAPPVGNTRVEYQFCDPASAPVFLAYQDGAGAWQAVTGSTTAAATTFAFQLTQGRGGVLVVYRTASAAVSGKTTVGRMSTAARTAARLRRAPSRMRARFDMAASGSGAPDRFLLADAYVTELYYGSTAELVQDAAGMCALTRPRKTVTGTVVGVSPGQYGLVSLGWGHDVFNGATSSNPVTFTDVAPGSVDFVGSRMTPGNAPDRIVVFRNLDIPDGGSLPAAIDFGGPASSVPATATATITGAAGDDLEIYVDVVTANGDALLWYDLSPSTATTRPWAGLGPAAAVSGDFHGTYVFASPSSGADFRFTLRYTGAVANQTLALGPTIPAPTVSQVGAGVYPRFRFQGTFPSEYDRGASMDVASTEESGNALGILVTRSYLAAAGNALAYDLTMPDVAGLAGFPVASRLTAGPNDVAVSAFGFTGPGIFDVRPNLGSEFRASIRGATISVP